MAIVYVFEKEPRHFGINDKAIAGSTIECVLSGRLFLYG
jgi:hypothetical protein